MSLRMLINRCYNISCKEIPKCKIFLPQPISNAVRCVTFKLEEPVTDPNKKVPKRKTIEVPKITLIAPGDDISITTLEEAQKISKRRDLKLVKVIDLDTKTQRPVYQLMTGQEFLAEDLKQRAERKQNKNETSIKGEKLVTISYRITDNDLNSRIKNISKWLTKKYEVRAVINGEMDNMTAAEAIYKKMENQLKAEGRFLQKRQKGSDIRFQILPPKRENQKVNDS